MSEIELVQTADRNDPASPWPPHHLRGASEVLMPTGRAEIAQSSKRIGRVVVPCLVRFLLAMCWLSTGRFLMPTHFGSQYGKASLSSFDVEARAPSDSSDSPKTRTSLPELEAGEVVTISASGEASVAKTDPAELERQLAWSSPLRRLDGMTLKDAVQLFNRHNVLKLKVSTPELDQIRLSGSFRLAEPEKFAESLQRLGIDHVMQDSGSGASSSILLVHK
jgi:hypothetical protein